MSILNFLSTAIITSIAMSESTPSSSPEKSGIGDLFRFTLSYIGDEAFDFGANLFSCVSVGHYDSVL